MSESRIALINLFDNLKIIRKTQINLTSLLTIDLEKNLQNGQK
jgi:hypothetical protein